MFRSRRTRLAVALVLLVSVLVSLANLLFGRGGAGEVAAVVGMVAGLVALVLLSVGGR